MSVVVEVHPPHPRAGRYVNWQAYRWRFPEPAPPIWRTCPHCWGQGRIYETNLIGFELCPNCLGFREVPSL